MSDSNRDALRKEIQDLFAAGDWARCRERLNAALERMHGDAELLNDSGVVAYAEGRLYEAISLFRSALSLRPGDSEASENYLRALLGAGLNHAAWCFLRETGRTCESLTRPPEAVRVAVAVNVRGAGTNASSAELDRCLAAIREQSYPVAETVVVVHPGPFEAIAAAATANSPQSQSHCVHVPTSGAPSARRASLLGTRAEVIVWVDSDVAMDPLWIEIAIRKLVSGECAGVAGRLLEVHEATLGDRWRAAHLGGDPGLVASDPAPTLYGGVVIYRTDALAQAISGDTTGAALLDRALAAGFRRRGLRLGLVPDAIAWRHTSDSIESVLDDWCAEETARLEAEGAFSSAVPFEGLTLLRAHYATLAFDRLHADVSAGRKDLGYPDFLLFFWTVLRDVEHLGRTGRVPMDACVAAASTFLSETWKALDSVPAVPGALLEATARRVLGGLGEFGRAVATTVSKSTTPGIVRVENTALLPLRETLVSVVEAYGPILEGVWTAIAAEEAAAPTFAFV